MAGQRSVTGNESIFTGAREPFSDWNETRPAARRIARRAAATVALAGAVFGFGGQAVAHADEKPLKNGWAFQFAGVGRVGTPAPPEGYREVCSVIQDHLNAKYGVAYGPQNDWSGPVYDLTRDQMLEHRATVFKDDPRAEIIWVQNLVEKPENVIDCKDMTGDMDVEIDYIREDHTIPPGQPNHGTDDDIKPKPQPEPTPTPGTPAPQPTPVETPKPTPTAPPAKPVPSKPVVKTVTYTVQVDRERAKDKKGLAYLIHRDDDRKADRASSRKAWGHVTTKAEFVKVTVPVKSSFATIAKAVNAKSTVGDISTSAQITTMRMGQSVTTAWILGPKSTPKHYDVTPQTYLGRSVVR